MGPVHTVMTSEDKIQVPKLSADGANWVDYRDRLLWLLESHSIEEHIQHDTLPTSYTTLGKIGGLEPLERWRKEEFAIRQVIGPSIPSSAFTRVKSNKSVKSVWEALKQIYEEKTRALVADLIRRFRNTRCGENDDVRAHFENLANLKEQLAAMGKTVSDEDYTDILLASLPTSYDATCSSISHSARLGSKPLTTATFESMILDEYTRREIKKGKHNTKDEAFSADAPRPKKQCTNCNKRGHLKADCWAKGGGKEGQGPKRGTNGSSNANANAKDKAASAEEKELEAWAVIEEEDADDEWIEVAAAAGSPSARAEQARGAMSELYDSGASRHMSSSKE